MKSIPLKDHVLSVNDLSNFELQLQAKQGRISATYDSRTSPQGTEHIGLTGAAVEFDESQTPEEEIDLILKKYGFQRSLA